jgi:hypothetical protein
MSFFSFKIILIKVNFSSSRIYVYNSTKDRIPYWTALVVFGLGRMRVVAYFSVLSVLSVSAFTGEDGERTSKTQKARDFIRVLPRYKSAAVPLGSVTQQLGTVRCYSVQPLFSIPNKVLSESAPITNTENWISSPRKHGCHNVDHFGHRRKCQYTTERLWSVFRVISLFVTIGKSRKCSL